MPRNSLQVRPPAAAKPALGHPAMSWMGRQPRSQLRASGSRLPRRPWNPCLAFCPCQRLQAPSSPLPNAHRLAFRPPCRRSFASLRGRNRATLHFLVDAEGRRMSPEDSLNAMRTFMETNLSPHIREALDISYAPAGRVPAAVKLFAFGRRLRLERDGPGAWILVTDQAVEAQVIDRFEGGPGFQQWLLIALTRHTQ